MSNMFKPKYGVTSGSSDPTAYQLLTPEPKEIGNKQNYAFSEYIADIQIPNKIHNEKNSRDSTPSVCQL